MSFLDACQVSNFSLKLTNRKASKNVQVLGTGGLSWTSFTDHIADISICHCRGFPEERNEITLSLRCHRTLSGGHLRPNLGYDFTYPFASIPCCERQPQLFSCIPLLD
jgi:hypothetical protein